MASRKLLLTRLAFALGAALIVVCAVLAGDSVHGGSPSLSIIVLRILVLTMAAGTYGGVLLYYGRRNVAFNEKLQAAVDAPTPEPKRKKKKKR